MTNQPKSELHIQQITDVAPHADGSRIVLRAHGQVADERAELEIAVTTELAPAMAVALLQTTAQARSARDELAPSLDVLGAAVVCSSAADRVRLQLLFEKGAVLPLELTVEAAAALSRGLAEYLASAQRRLVPRYGRSLDPV